MKHELFFWGMMVFVGTTNAAFAAKVVGQVGLIQGEVLVNSKAIRKGASVTEGSVIETKEESKATLLLGKGSVFHIGPESKMVITQYDVKPQGDESGELELKFGRTRALILNQGNEKKDLKIKARAATMGVRGTEIYIDSPKDPAQPAQFFTLEGKAEVVASAGAPAVAVNQNQGVSSTGAPPSTSVAQVKEEIKAAGMAPPPAGNSSAATAVAPPRPPALTDSFGPASIPPIVLDPLRASVSNVVLMPTFSSATN